MSVEMAIWRMNAGGPQQLAPSQLDLEQQLEDMLADDPGMKLRDERMVRTDESTFKLSGGE